MSGNKKDPLQRIIKAELSRIGTMSVIVSSIHTMHLIFHHLNNSLEILVRYTASIVFET